MATPKLSRLELQIMESLWTRGDCSIREIQDGFPEKNRPAYTTVQTTVYRMESKQVVKRVKKIGNSLIFSAAVTRGAAQSKFIDDLLSLFGGRIQPVVAHLVRSGKFTRNDVKEAQELLQKLAGKEKSQ